MQSNIAQHGETTPKTNVVYFCVTNLYYAPLHALYIYTL